jgi:Mrp family chromosome partitioning ATPase
VVARWVDGVVVVVAAHQTPRTLLENALDVVEPAKLVGIVFNGFDDIAGSRRGRHYAGYYTPAEEDEAERVGALTRISQKVGSMLRRGEEAAVRDRRARDRSQ